MSADQWDKLIAWICAIGLVVYFVVMIFWR
ncbi:hypothetical protein UFOVP118_8 [uncultured Caudovirales phage]|uniref:Uncharacterized protein n=1 Tax=uncultured Caudovirales phage TaxID=2100421 RepID=A0A6J5L3S3_9CAUD|nr:hypothetical protein UFOVP118_8 [uncultured Caudovirales phage]